MMQAAMWLVLFCIGGNGYRIGVPVGAARLREKNRQSALLATVDKSAVKLQSMRPRVAFGSSSRHESYVRLWRNPTVALLSAFSH